MELPDAADFRANPAAEAQSRAQTARLYNMSDDPGVRDMLKFNLVRDTLHQNLWLKAMGSVPAPDPKLYATYDGSMGQPSGINDLAGGPMHRVVAGPRAPGVIRGEGMSPIRSAPRRGERARQIRRWVPRPVLLALAVLTTGCDSKDLPRLGFLPPATKQGQVVLTLWQGSWAAALLVGALIWGALIWAVIFYRKRGDRVPAQVRYNLPLEILYTVLPFIMVGGLFYFTARDESYVDKFSRRPDVVVNVTGFQWGWEFQYPQYRASGVKSVNGVNGATAVVTELGAMSNPNQSFNRQLLPLLEIPEHETVRFNLVSLDVVHSFWIVPFEFKRDVIPGHPNHFEVTPTRTGTWTGRCSEFCGLNHSRMLFAVKIVSPAQFKHWIKTQQALQNASGGTQ